MNFWDSHDLALLRLRKEAIDIIEQFEKEHSHSEKNYYKKLNSLINRKIGKKVKLLTSFSVAKSVFALSSQNN